MNDKQAGYLAKLAKHLEAGKLGHKVFNFNFFNANADGFEVRGKCGTMGCAAGELPIIFPRKWKFDEHSGLPVLRNGDYQSPSISGEDFFEISGDEFDHLFQPGRQSPHLYGGKYLRGFATRKQVAANIWAFLTKKGYKKSQFKDVKP